MQLYGVIHRQNHFKVLSVWFRSKKKILWSKPITQGIQKDLILAPNYISLLLHQPAPTGLNTVNANKHTMEFDVRFQCLLGRDSDKPSLIGLIWSSWRLFQTSKVMAVLYTLSQPPWIGAQTCNFSIWQPYLFKKNHHFPRSVLDGVLELRDVVTSPNQKQSPTERNNSQVKF